MALVSMGAAKTRQFDTPPREPPPPSVSPTGTPSLQYACMEFVCANASRFPSVLSHLPKDVEDKLILHILTHHVGRAYDIFKQFRVQEDLIVDAIIADETGRALWKRHFPGKKAVPWEDLALVLKRLFKGGEPTLLESEADQDHYYRCLLVLLKDIDGCKEADNMVMVTVDNFAALLRWFGPLNKGFTMLVEIRDLLVHRWFHGCISEDEAFRRLHNKLTAGGFLVRLCKPQGCFYVSVVSRKEKVKHYQITYNSKKAPFAYSARDTECRSLLEAMMLYACWHPCTGFKFARLFLNM